MGFNQLTMHAKNGVIQYSLHLLPLLHKCKKSFSLCHQARIWTDLTPQFDLVWYGMVRADC